MPKPIKLTPAWIQSMVDEFTKALGKVKMSDGKVTFTKSFTYDNGKDERAIILFEPAAYAKMLMLLDRFSDEIAWHGVVERLDAKTFVIKDILVYPQEVTGSTVTTDQTRYQTWLMELPDETFNALHMQGHSHVNMTTSPSSVDRNFYDSIISQLGDKDFYIFMIFNKRLDHFVAIYDMETNTLYEDKDVSIGIRCEEGDLESFLTDAKEIVVKKPYVAPSTASYGGYSQKWNSGKDDDDDDWSKKNSDAKKKSESARSSYYDGRRTTQSPGYYGGYPDVNGEGVTDYDEYVFGKRNYWWNRA